MKHEETARRLKEAMIKKGWKQQQLANESGVSKYNISHYINGKTVPDNIQAYKLAKVLDVSPEWLMALDQAQKYIVVENSDLQQEIANMTQAQLDRLLKYAQQLRKEKK